jgi:hypothetical protein
MSSYFSHGINDAPPLVLPLPSNSLKRASARALGLITGYFTWTLSGGVIRHDSREDLTRNLLFCDIIQVQRFQLKWRKRLIFVSNKFDSTMKQFWEEVFDGIACHHNLGAHASRGASPDDALELYVFCVSGEHSMHLYTVLNQVHTEALLNSDTLLTSVDECNNLGVIDVLLPELYASHFMGIIILLAMRLSLMQHMIETISKKRARVGRLGYY